MFIIAGMCYIVGMNGLLIKIVDHEVPRFLISSNDTCCSSDNRFSTSNLVSCNPVGSVMLHLIYVMMMTILFADVSVL